MRDYDSIAKSLRCCVSDSEPCEHCNCELEECTPKTIMEIAADAIEELLEEKAKLENTGKFLVAAFDLAKEKLEKYRHAAFIISETCVDESKGHISPEDAIKKIRESIYYDNTASCSDPLDEVV